MEKLIRLTSNKVLPLSEIIERIENGEILYGYFDVEDQVIVDEITLANYDLLSDDLLFKVSEGENKMTGYLMVYNRYPELKGKHPGKWLFCHKLVDEYKVRNGLYGDIFSISDKSTVRNIIHHIDEDKLNNNPDNLARVTREEHAEYHSDLISRNMADINKNYKDEFNALRKARYTRTQASREYGRLLLTAVKVFKKYGSLTEEIYDSHKFEFSKRPAKWSRLVERFGSQDAINEAISSYYDDLKDMNSKGKISIYAAGPFFNEKQVNTIRTMEKVLESRGYEVYSPSRDGIMLTPNASKEDRLQVFQENVENCIGQDLVIAVVDDRDQGTMIEIGMKYGYWHAQKQMGLVPPDQKVPRMITFSNDGWDLNIMLLGAVMKHCKGFDELVDYLDILDKNGLDNMDIDESVYSERCF